VLNVFARSCRLAERGIVASGLQTCCRPTPDAFVGAGAGWPFASEHVSFAEIRDCGGTETLADVCGMICSLVSPRRACCRHWLLADDECAGDVRLVEVCLGELRVCGGTKTLVNVFGRVFARV
jgi:hypothetical protein